MVMGAGEAVGGVASGDSRPVATIRAQCDGDAAVIAEVNLRAFPTAAEAKLVQALAGAGVERISLVAELDGAVVGHILFTPVEIEGAAREVRSMGLGPMAVLPEHQRRGIGGALIRAGLATCAGRRVEAVFVLGHEDYYPRFGFVPAAPLELHFPSPAADAYFFVQELVPGVLDGITGTVLYHPLFDVV
jgi:putative acetyltransferase